MDTFKHNESTIISKLFHLNGIEQKEQLDVALEESYAKLVHLLNPLLNLSDSHVNNELISYSSQSRIHLDDVCNALLFSILTTSDTTHLIKCLRYLLIFNANSSQTLSNESQFSLLINNLILLALDLYTKLLDLPRIQMLWLLKELSKSKLPNVDKILVNMLRNIQTGNLSERNLWLADQLLDILVENFDSLLGGELLQNSLYTYLRILSDHYSAQCVLPQGLREKELAFVVKLMREKWLDCMVVGRDLVRLLQNLAKLPEIESILRDMTLNPQVLHPQFTGIQSLLKTPTRRRCFISRLTPDMERKLFFLITNVKFGSHKRYQDWFQKQYLSTPESQSLRVDLIRYICAVVHPTNEQLNSNLIPRWAVIGWLLSTCTNTLDIANMKLALFFDWFFYDAKKDNIMLIEPAVLLMFNSLRTHVNMTHMLFDFLVRIIYGYSTHLREQIYQGILNALKDSVDKRVIPSIQIFFDNNKLDASLKSLVQNTLPTLFGSNNQLLTSNPIITQLHSPVSTQSGLLTPPIENTSLCASKSEQMGFFSDDEQDDQIDEPLEDDLKPLKMFITDDITDLNPNHCLSHLNENLAKLVSKLNTSNFVNQKRVCNQIVSYLAENPSTDTQNLALCLLHFLKNNFTNSMRLLNSKKIGLFVIFKHFESTPHAHTILLDVLKQMFMKQKRVNYYFLLYLSITNSHNRVSAYRELLRLEYDENNDENIDELIMNDLKLIEDDDFDMFMSLVPFVLRHFGHILVNNVDFVYLIVQQIDTQQMDVLQENLISKEDLVLFKFNQKLIELLTKSLEWSSIDQIFLWKLITLHLNSHTNITFVCKFLLNNNLSQFLVEILKLNSNNLSLELVETILTFDSNQRSVHLILNIWLSMQNNNRFRLVLEKLIKKLSTTQKIEVFLLNIDSFVRNSSTARLFLPNNEQDAMCIQALVRVFNSNDEFKRKYVCLWNDLSNKQKSLPKITHSKLLLTSKKQQDYVDNDSSSDLDTNDKQPPRKKAKHIVSSDDNESS